MYRFEKLRVYQDAMTLVESIYMITRKFPADEKFALSDQIKRSSSSIILNIAEGTGSLGDIEFKSYLRNALKSLYETVACLKLSEKLFNSDVQSCLIQCDCVGKQLNGLINSLSKQKTND